MKKTLLRCAVIALVIVFAAAAVRFVERSAARQGREQLDTALRQAAVTCYAAEGIYPPSVAYLQEHYGIRIDERYTVFYDVFADNLMPDITVLERE